MQEDIYKFNNLFDYFYQNNNNLNDKNKIFLYDNAFNIITKINDTNLKEDILSKLIILFPKDVSLYSKLGLIYKNVNIQKSILWHNIGFNIDPMCEENTINLCILYFEKGMTKKIIEFKKSNLFNKLVENDTFLGIYSRCNFQELHYKNGINYLLKLIEKKTNYICFTKEEQLEKWKNYHDSGYVFCKLGEHEKSLQNTSTAVELANKFNLDITKKLLSFSNLIFFTQYSYYDNNTNYELHLKTNDYYLSNKQIAIKNEKKFKKNITNHKKPIVQPKIRIGYLSGDYKYHPIANFIIPILENYDKSKFEIFLYANQNNNEVIDLFTNLKLNIHYIINLTDDQVSELINVHKIDILFDLCGHSIMNRLGIFSLNVAPIQITYLGYPNTTGLNTMHYRITDHIADNDLTKQKYSETLLRVPKCFLLYKNVMDPVNRIPKKTDKTIILGAINKEEKNSKYAMFAWKEILRQCPNTKIMIKLETFDNNEERMEFYSKHLETTRDRIIIINKLQNKEYCEVFTKFDILLDTFPYSGTTTTCNTLHNSLPVVTLYHKDYHSHNVSSSILINASLPELVAYSMDEYINIVKQLVDNPSRIEQYKKVIGENFKKSMEPKKFMKYYEDALTQVYNQYYYNEPIQNTECDTPYFQEFIEKSKLGYDYSNVLITHKLDNTLQTRCDIDLIENINDITLPEIVPSTNSSNISNSVIFISVFDYGSIDLGINHLISLRNANIYNYMAYVTDDQSYQRLYSNGFNVTKIQIQDDDKHNSLFQGTQKNFGTKDFTEFSFLRYKIIHQELTKYEAVWYMDVDTVVLQDLNKYYDRYKNGKTKYDIIYQNDIHEINHCTGCVLYFSNPFTLKATQVIYNGMNSDIPDQHYTHNFLEKYGKSANIGLFETYEFPNGLLYFDKEDLIELSSKFNKEKQKYNNKSDKVVAFVHANWMVGINNKINVLKKKKLWFSKNQLNL